MSSAMLRRLEVFCAVIDAGGATQAAVRLGMSQPAVSQQIARLEEELGLALFVRSQGRMRPTETALTIFDEASHALDGLERVLNLARDIRGLDRGLLRVAAPHSAAAAILPAALRRMTAEHPRVRFSVQLGAYERIVGLIAAREADLGIAKAPVLTPGVESLEICASPLVAVLARDNPLAERQSLGVQDLAREPLVMIGRGRPWRDGIDVEFRRAGIAPRVAVETQSVESACGFAAAGFGTAIAPEWLVAAVMDERVVRRPFDIGIVHRFLVVYPARTARLELAQDFLRACQAVTGVGAG
jgi:DNA-binding transcriptional LysR family regulator